MLLSGFIYFTGCQQIAEEEVTDATESSTTSVVNVSTRASENTSVTYPVQVYAFNAISGKLTAQQTITSENTSIGLTLGLGDYKIVALAGVSEDYSLPASPSLTDVITIATKGIAHTPMMMGKADFSVTKTGKTSQLTITLGYTVASLSITLDNIPSEVQGVKVGLSSFYTTLTFGGEYGGGGKVISLDCEQTDEDEWVADGFYLFPTDKQETLYSITFEYANSSTTYAYTYPAALVAGSPFNFVGSYNSYSYIEGSLVVDGWTNPVDVNFSFGSEDSGSDSNSSNNPDNGNSSINVNSLPNVVDIWQGGIVLQVSTSSDTEADVLLMTLDEWSTTLEKYESCVNDYNASSEHTWRLLEEEEVQVIKPLMTSDMLTTINQHIAQQTTTYDEVTSEDGVRYLCLKSGVPYTFRFEVSGKVTKAGSTKSYLLRLVRTVHCQL
jgi:hypothetical protein